LRQQRVPPSNDAQRLNKELEMRYPEQELTGAYQRPPAFTAEQEASILAGTWNGRGNAPKQPPGERQSDGLTRHVTTDVTGRQISTFSGEPISWMAEFMGPRHLMIRINKHAKGFATSGGRSI
jgi:hypothetical protein